MKTIIQAAAALCIACAVAGLLLMKQPPAREEASPTAKAASQQEPRPAVAEALPAAPSEEAPPAAAETVAAPTPSAAPEAALSASPAPADKQVRNARASQGGGGAKEPLKDPLAREALALVGLDPAAEAYWHAAINDPDLSAHERQDLIEDLNEDGLSDPKNPYPEDFPVILNRIRLLEAAGPYAMDQVNADAFAEAYKDLVNLANRALGGGGPVR
jgi:hypothetical protein